MRKLRNVVLIVVKIIVERARARILLAKRNLKPMELKPINKL